jgi:hypothetical protein
MHFGSLNRGIPTCPQSSEGWQNFTAGWAVGSLSGVAWGYVLTKVHPPHLLGDQFLVLL